MKNSPVIVVGAGLAGSEAAYRLACSGVPVVLYEMRPGLSSPVHSTDYPAELVCSNSFGSDDPGSAPGMLKAEMRILGSLVMEAADYARVPAGQALAVDREKFSHYVLEKLSSLSNISIIREEASRIPEDSIVIIATGPLTSEKMADSIQSLIGSSFLNFFDAVSPVVLAESINRNIVFEASRYGKGTPDYLNCPMSKEEFASFYRELINAELVNPHDFEEGRLFQGCMPVEEMAKMGEKTLLFGPLKPVGLSDDAAAVVQLRKENVEGTMYSLVGFQTRLRWGEQKRVFRMIPGLEKAEFVRYGVMHKNIYINSPSVLSPTLQLKKHNNVFISGQLTGVEGYTESAAMGIVAGINAARLYYEKELVIFPPETAVGSLIKYITDPFNEKKFQPMNINFGILPQAEILGKKKDKRAYVAARGIKKMLDFIKNGDRHQYFLHTH